MDELGKHGSLKNMRLIKEKRGRNIAENMLKAGMRKTFKWITSTVCVVPSQTSEGTLYEIHLWNCSCTCPASTQRGQFWQPHKPNLKNSTITNTM